MKIYSILVILIAIVLLGMFWNLVHFDNTLDLNSKVKECNKDNNFDRLKDVSWCTKYQDNPGYVKTMELVVEPSVLTFLIAILIGIITLLIVMGIEEHVYY